LLAGVLKKALIGSVVILLTFIGFLVTLGQYSKLLMMTLSVIVLIMYLIRKEMFNELMHFNMRLISFQGIALLASVATFTYLAETSIWSLSGIVADYPAIGFPAQIFLWLSFTHLISYAIHGLLFIYLWHKWRRILPAFLTTLFEISMSEFGFIGPQLYQFGFIFVWTWTWYIGFVVVCLPFIALRKSFDLSDKRLWLTFFLGVVVLFINAIFGFRDPWAWDNATHSFRLFPELVYEPTAWFNMYINRVGKILMASAFAFVKMRD
jgi:hypothetical protein